MKRLTKWILIAISLLLCTSAVSAFAVSSIVVDPSGAMVGETPVIVSYRIDFTASGDETFPSGDEIQMSTDLESAKWSYSLVLDGVETVQPATSGRVLTVSGWVLSYPASVEENLKVTLEGKAPTVTKTTNKTMIRICEYDSHGNLLSSSCVERTAVIVNPKEITDKINEMKGVLQTYRSHIDEKSALGVDTAGGEAKYSEANQKITSAASRLSNQYMLAYADLDAAQVAIDDGETALDRAWAENELANAQIPINDVDRVIQWFKSNASTKDDAQLPAIIAKREVAVSYLVTSQDEINNGNYDQARVKAQDAFNKGNEAYQDILARQKTVSENPFLQIIETIKKFFGGFGLIIVGVIVVVLIIVGVVIYRKRSHWDELG